MSADLVHRARLTIARHASGDALEIMGMLGIGPGWEPAAEHRSPHHRAEHHANAGPVMGRRVA